MTKRHRLLKYSYNHKLSHIPSALSMHDYLYVLFAHGHVTTTDYIVIGKPFGSQSYYLLWEQLGWLDDISNLSVGVKHDEIPFVDYSEETLGNALGVAAGIAMTTKKRVWVNITDATLQMGNTLEAIQFIGHNQLSNILVTVDYNGKQVTGDTARVLNVSPVISMFDHYGWNVYHVNGHSTEDVQHVLSTIDTSQPVVLVCHTEKGHGCPTMMTDLKTWHYRRIQSPEELQALINESYTA